MLERKVQHDAMKMLEGFGWLVYKTEAVGRRGYPDLTCISPDGGVIFIEVKGPSGRLRREQARLIARWRERGVTVWIIHGKEELKNEIAGFIGGAGSSG